MKKKDSNFELFKAYFSQDISKEIVDYATDVALLHSRYIFTHRVGNIQYGYCTHCKKEYMTEGLKHGKEATCKKCNSKCVVKASGMGRKYMRDEAYFIHYEKSLINPQALVARGINVLRAYNGDYYKVETRYICDYMYLFEPGNAELYELSWRKEWLKRKSIISQFNTSMANIRCFVSQDNIKKAVKGTPFQYSTWENYIGRGYYQGRSDMVKFFDLAARYPCIEYLTKLDFGEVVEAKIEGRTTHHAINWRGKTVQKVLKLSKSDIKEIRETTKSIGPLFLKLFQLSKKDQSNLSTKDIYEIFIGYGSYLTDLQKLLKYTTLRKAHVYIKKQYERKNEKKRHYYDMYQVLHSWRDYLADCKKLDMDISSENVMFPSNLYTAHQNTIKQIKVKEDIALRAQIAKRVRSLQKFSFESHGLLIRPAEDSLELIEEGKNLQHCVGTYAPRYAKGEIDLFVLRKVAEPDKPFFTVEVRKGDVTQCRGLKNCNPSKDVKAFIETFKQEKLSTKGTKKRKRVEVAV